MLGREMEDGCLLYIFEAKMSKDKSHGVSLKVHAHIQRHVDFKSVAGRPSCFFAMWHKGKPG